MLHTFLTEYISNVYFVFVSYPQREKYYIFFTLGYLFMCVLIKLPMEIPKFFAENVSISVYILL